MTRRPSGRLSALLVVCCLVFAVIGVRLMQLQVVGAQPYTEMGNEQRIRRVELPARRGDLLDRNGIALALSVPAYRVVADPKHLIATPGRLDALARVIGVDGDDLRRRVRVGRRYVVLAQQVDADIAERVRSMKIAGIGLEEHSQRFNPAGELARSVIGTVGQEHRGLSGLELALDRSLVGTPGKLIVEQDPRRNEIPTGSRHLEPPRPGASYVLSIDQALQFEVERLLVRAVQAYNSKKGVVIVMDPTTGDILAVANVVAGQRGASPRTSSANDALVGVYEMGSVNKVVTIAAALQEGEITPTQYFDVPDQLQVADHLFRDEHQHGLVSWSARDILTQSSNVGTIQIARKLGKHRIDQYLRAFGFGKTTAVNFPGESAGILLPPEQWSGTSIGTVPIGQGIAVTPLQQLVAYNVLANEGRYVAPRLVRATVDEQGRATPRPIREGAQVVSAGVAADLRDMLSEVVRSGTGREAIVSGYTVAGKTGTARKPNPIARGYLPGAYIATFAGFVPAHQPRLSMLVILDEPTPYYGGKSAAPLFADIARFALRHYRIAPDSALRGPVVQSQAVPDAPEMVDGDPTIDPRTGAGLPDPPTGAAVDPGTNDATTRDSTATRRQTTAPRVRGTTPGPKTARTRTRTSSTRTPSTRASSTRGRRSSTRATPPRAAVQREGSVGSTVRVESEPEVERETRLVRARSLAVTSVASESSESAAPAADPSAE